jgi:hypothetical protein
MSPTAIPARAEAGAEARGDSCKARVPDGLGLRLLAVFSKGADPCQGRVALDALREGVGASCVVFLRGQDCGWRVECESAAPGFAAMAPPAEAMSRLGAVVMTLGSPRGETWATVGDESGRLVARLDGAHEDAQAFETAGALVAQFLARCYSAEESPDGADALLCAVSSLVHDSLDIVTGLAMCAGICSQRRRSQLSTARHEELILDRTAASLEALCREYSRLDRAVSARLSRSCAGELVVSYVALLSALGIEVERTALDDGFVLSAHARGVALRALVHLALAMLEVGAREARVRTRTTGASRITVSFVCEKRALRHLGRAVAGAIGLVDAKGGRAEVRRRGRCVAVSFAFANAPCGAGN